MRIISYKFYDQNDKGWCFNKLNFKRINLMVGDSGVGKSRLLNTLSNLAKVVTSEKIATAAGWKIIFKIKEDTYTYYLKTETDDEKHEVEVVCEELVQIVNDEKSFIIKRTQDIFEFNGSNLPKLSPTTTAVKLLQIEPAINIIFDGFKSIITRRFFSDELSKHCGLYAIPHNHLQSLSKNTRKLDVLNAEIGIHNKLYLIKEAFPQVYDDILNTYKEAFPFIESFEIREISQIADGVAVPFSLSKVFCIKERKVDDYVAINDISSGMQKLFLLILDVYLLDAGGVLLIDEYENSLGLNAINFFPELISQINTNCQFIITSHHPYIVNKIPIENWFVFHREGMKVTIKSGEELKDKYNGSHQENYIQLINDPFFSQGVS